MAGFAIPFSDRLSLLKMVLTLHQQGALDPETLWRSIYTRKDNWRTVGSIEACDQLFEFFLSLEELHEKNSEISKFSLNQLLDISEIAKKAMVIYSKVNWS